MPENEILIYRTDDGRARVDVRFESETVWLSQAELCKLYESSKSNISEHIKHIFEEGELEEVSTVRNFRTVASNGKTYDIAHYNLDMIIALGYRVRSPRGTQFRKWATERLREYLVKGFALDDERLKRGGGNYWKELLARIRDIRSSEKVLYRQVLDLYATATDYDPKSDASLLFFKTVQNKLHYAAHGHTASQVIFERANAEKPFMGLTTFSGDFPTKKDIGIAKNYLNETELRVLNNLVSGYFDIAEANAIERRPMSMADHLAQLDAILAAGGRNLLESSGTTSRRDALAKAEREYRKFQAETLSPVEAEYLETLKGAAKKAKRNSKEKGAS